MPVAAEAPRSTSSSTPRIQPITESDGERVAIYGPGGIGKSSLALAAPGVQVWIDLDRSLGKLKRSGADLSRVKGQIVPRTFDELYAALNDFAMWEGVDTLVLDSFTVVEEMAVVDVLERHNTKKGKKASSIADYDFGDGHRFLYDRDDRILQSLENHARRGRNIVLICHEGTRKFKNAMGEDFMRVAPDVVQYGQFSFADRLQSWTDHLLYVGYDNPVSKGKTEGSGTRTIYTAPKPSMLAKSRTIEEPEVPYERGDVSVWNMMFVNGAKPNEAIKPESNPITNGENK